jgi:hypothetical protein
MIDIDKGIPLPSEKQPNRSKYPWKFLAVGDSFIVENGRGAAALCWDANRRQAPKKFIWAYEDKGKSDKARIWRTE